MKENGGEVPLKGGNTTSGVVRIGETVRRPVKPTSRIVHRLLVHLENAGFGASPRFLGLDDKGREILSFIEGTTAFPDDLWTSREQIVAATAMLRRYHDLTQGFDGFTSSDWAFSYPDKSRHEVICHNDYAPYNTVFRAGQPAGIIDFDLAGPGPRMRDLAYLAYWMVPLSFASGDMFTLTQTQRAAGFPRLRLVCATYGVEQYSQLLSMVSEVLHDMSNEALAISMVGESAAGHLKREGHLSHWKTEASAFDDNIAAISDIVG